MKNNPNLNLRIWGYRNTWSHYKPAEAERIIPDLLNSFNPAQYVQQLFYKSEIGSFPSYELTETFSQLAQKIWVEQHNQITHLVGQDYFFKNPNPLLRMAFGAIYLKDMSYQEFTAGIKDVRRLLKAKEELESNP
jgi:glucosamine-6-phosphate deaminase